MHVSVQKDGNDWVSQLTNTPADATASWAQKLGIQDFNGFQARANSGMLTPQDIAAIGQVSSVAPQYDANGKVTNAIDFWSDAVTRAEHGESGNGGIFGIKELSTGIPLVDNAASGLLSGFGATGYNAATGGDVKQGAAIDLAGLAAGAGLAEALPALGLSTVAPADAIGNAVGGTVTAGTGTGSGTAGLTNVADTGIASGGPMPAGVTAGGGVDAINAAVPGSIAKGLTDAELATLGIGGAVGGTVGAVAGTGGAGITPTEAAVGTAAAGTAANAVNPNADPNTNINTGPADGLTGQTTDPNSTGVTNDGVPVVPGTTGGTNTGDTTGGINDIINGITGGTTDWGSLLTKYGPALIGGILAAKNNQPAPITQTPWNAQYFGPLQNQATDLMQNNKLDLPTVPNLPGLPDIANTDAAKAYADSVVKRMGQTFTDPGGPLAAIRSDFTANQPGGGTRQQLAEGVAAGREGEAEGLARNQIMNAIYGTNLNYNQARATQDISNQQWGFGQTTGRNTALFNAPWQNLSQAGNIFTGAAGKGSTTVLPSTPWWQTGVGGALATQGLVNAVNKG